MSIIVPITGDTVLKTPKKKGDKTAVEHDFTADESIEKTEVDDILLHRDQYSTQRQSKVKEWIESFKMYMSWVDTTANPFMSNLFIPKVHEAVEILSAWLIGKNQSINASPENTGDTQKAQVAEKWLDFLWRKVIKARLKILTWIKQGIIFGNGILKVGYDSEKKVPWMNTTAIEDVYFDFFMADIQDSPYIIHELRKGIDSVINNKSFNKKDSEGNFIRESVVEGGSDTLHENADVKFSAYDNALITSESRGKVPIMEAWKLSTNEIITIAPTSLGWRILKKVPNSNKWSDGTFFRPFIKLRFKVSPLPNRAYDTSAIFPTVKIQKAFNDLMNEYFDNVVLVNNKMWIKRRGARISPMELVRRPGGVINVGNINKDIKSEEVSDIKNSIVEMLNRLDAEFQQASMVVNLLKGVGGGADFAIEVEKGQQSFQTLLDMIDENIGEALSEAGSMILAISAKHMKEMQTVKLYENESELGLLDFKPSDISGKYDVKVTPDRSAGTSKIVRQKQLIDFLKIVGADQTTVARYPDLPKKIYEKWLEEAGFADINFFFGTPVETIQGEGGGEGSPGRLPGVDKNLSEKKITEGATKVVA